MLSPVRTQIEYCLSLCFLTKSFVLRRSERTNITASLAKTGSLFKFLDVLMITAARDVLKKAVRILA